MQHMTLDILDNTDMASSLSSNKPQRRLPSSWLRCLYRLPQLLCLGGMNVTLSQHWNVLEISMLISLGLVLVTTLLFCVAVSLKSRNLRDGRLLLTPQKLSP